MRRSPVLLAVFLLLTTQAARPWGRQDTAAAAASPRISLKASLCGEYFTRTVEGEEDLHISQLETYLGLAGIGLGIGRNFEISVLGGYASSDMSGLLFQKLPFSISYEAGGITGYLLGAEMSYRIFAAGNLEMNGYGQYLSYSGKKKEWPIKDLNVDGTITGVSSWNRLSVGPEVKYTGFQFFTPYFSIRYDRLSASFEMRETIQTLAGIEEKKIKAKSQVSLSVGTIFEASSLLKIQGEASLLPRKGGVDTAFQIKTRFSF